MRVFISHSSIDIDFVLKLVSDLRKSGIDCWCSEKEISVADSIIARMNEGLGSADFVLAVLSENSLISPWVSAEINLALYEEIANGRTFLIPIILDSCRIPPLLKVKKYLSFQTEYNRPLEELIFFLQSQEAYKVKYENVIGIPVTSITEADSIFNNQYNKSVPQNLLNSMIVESQCLRKGDFQLTSGGYSNYYIMPRKVFYNKEAKDFFINLLTKTIRNENMDFDAIIFPALTDGGLLGNLLADNLDIKKRVPINIGHDKRNIDLNDLDIASLKNQKCLYVDDVITSGHSIKLAVNNLYKLGICISYVATLFCRNTSNFNLLANELKNANIKLITPFFAEIPMYVRSNTTNIKVEIIN